MLVINPTECTSCGACETECPVEAIYEDYSVPAELKEWVELNAWYTQSLSGERTKALQGRRGVRRLTAHP
jgi:ferredoxin